MARLGVPRETFGKSHEAAVLLEAYHNAKSPRVRAEYIRLLDNLWPGVRCTLVDGKIRVFYAQTQMKCAPETLVEAASYVEAVCSDGSALVVKDDHLGPHFLRASTYPLHKLMSESLPRPPPSVWDRLLDEDS